MALAESLSADFGAFFQLFPYRWDYLALAAVFCWFGRICLRAF